MSHAVIGATCRKNLSGERPNNLLYANVCVEIYYLFLHDNLLLISDINSCCCYNKLFFSLLHKINFSSLGL